MKLRWKRWLYLSHRWFGIALCLLFVAWFVSGIVMMYVGFPQLDRDERLTGLPALDFSSARLSPVEAVARLRDADFSVVGAPERNLPRDGVGDTVSPTVVRLGMLQGRPVYHLHLGGAIQPRTVFADDGELLQRVTLAMALQTAVDFAQRQRGMAFADARHAELLQTDQWTLSAAMNIHRPLHRVELGDAHGSELYVSSTTGEVVRDTARSERLLNYVGAVTHWIYPTVIRRHPELWAWLVDILAAAGVVLALTGLWIGVLRWKRRPKPGKPAVPYRGLMRWHYFSGIVFGGFALTWVFSGWLSMNPGGLNPSRAVSAQERSALSGVPTILRVADFVQPVPVFDGQTVEAELLHVDGVAAYLMSRRDGSRQLVSANDGSLFTVDLPRLRALLPALMPQSTLNQVQLLTGYDNYYYSRHPERGDKPLPTLRAMFADDAATWFHVDVATGQLLDRSTATNRLYRWLYNGLHSWDIYWLWQRRPLWDIALISFSLGGVLLSGLGVVVGWRRLGDGRRRGRARV